MRKSVFSCTVLAILVSGCASTPPVTVNYYHPRAELQLTTIQTLACDEGNQPYFATTVTPALAYRADYAQPRSLSFASLGGGGANVDAGVTLTDDGRLGGINATQTGIGTEIVNSVIGVAKALGFAAAIAPDPAVAAACTFVANSGEKKVVTFTYRHSELFEVPNPRPAQFAPVVRQLQPAPGQDYRYQQVAAIRCALCLAIEEVAEARQPRLAVAASNRDDIALALRHPATLALSVYHVMSSQCPGDPDDLNDEDLTWASRVMVPQWGTDYAMPIPRAALFGSQTTKLSLSEAGTPLTITYARTSGAAAALNAGAAYAGMAVQTDAEQALALDAEADVIAQQQRLVRCQTSPTTCPT